jgi:hypothetical protein
MGGVRGELQFPPTRVINQNIIIDLIDDFSSSYQ